MKKQTEFFLGYCGVTDDKIYFAVLCRPMCVRGGGGAVE